MIAVDTNVIVRLLMQDDRKQTPCAASLFAAHQVWIAKTVLLEVSWVLASFYKYRPEGVREALENLVGLPNVQVEDESAVESALALSAQGSISPTRCIWRAGRRAPGLHLSTKPSFAGPRKREWLPRRSWIQKPFLKRSGPQKPIPSPAGACS